MTDKKQCLFLTSPAGEWELATPVGNGYSGAMVFGGIGTERLQLSEEAIWSGGAIDTAEPDFRDRIDAIRRLLLDGDATAADAYAARELAGAFHRIKSQETAGDIVIDFTGGEVCTDYRRTLDLLHGVSTVSFRKDGEDCRRETFASYPDRVIAARHTGSHSATVTFDRYEADATLDWHQKLASADRSGRFGVRSVCFSGNTMIVTAAPIEGGREFTVKLRVKTDGVLTVDGERFHIDHATTTDYILAIGVGREPVLPECGYDTLKSRATADFASLMTRSEIDFGEDPYADLPVDRRIERLRNDPDARDPGLAALYVRFGKYLLVSSSRRGSLPANLQGVWNGYTRAPWNNDYHTNINLQMNYWHAEVANLADCTLPLFDYMNSYLLRSGRETARVNYRCRGTVLHHLSDIYGFTAAADGLWGLWPLGGAWLCYAMWEHYLFSRDLDFLRFKAYEYIRDSARFFLDYLFEDETGRLLSGPSTSPENRYLCNGQAAFLCLSPTMDREIIGGLLRLYIRTEELLHIHPEWEAEARQALEKLPPLQVGKYGQLMEWLEDYDEPEPGHRHISHLFALYPDDAITAKTPALFDAARVTIERRLANGGGHTGWSAAWLIALFARLGDAGRASDMLRKLLCHSTRGNLLDTHPPFQIDGNFGASAAILEMLLQSQNGRIVLLPAAPEEFLLEGSFTRLRVRGGAEVSARWRDGRVISCTLTAVSCDFAGVLVMNAEECGISLKQGESVTL